jgi:hypothetical protein
MRVRCRKGMRHVLPVALFVVAVLVAGVFSLLHASAMSNGAPQLDCTQCHQDAKNRPAEFVVQGLPEKVEPGKEYKITIKITKAPESKGAAYGGFAAAVSAGQLVVVDKQNTFITKTPTGQVLITHTKDGSMKREWTIGWKAPEKCSGTITFEISVIGANGDGSPFGDAYGYKTVELKCGGAKPSPTVTTTTIVETKTKTLVTTTPVGTTVIEKSNPGLAIGVAVLIFLLVVGGYLLFAGKK